MCNIALVCLIYDNVCLFRYLYYYFYIIFYIRVYQVYNTYNDNI